MTRKLFFFFSLLTFCTGLSAEETIASLVKIEEYKPMYFLMGTPDVKIQLSAKIKALENADLYFGYTQLMMWNLLQHNPFFRDVNYDPEFFYRFGLDDDAKEKWLDLGIYEHESNGKGGALERSWNRSYLRYHDMYKLGDWANLFLSFKVWVPYWFNPANRDIIHYRGLWEVSVTLANVFGQDFFQRSDLTLRLYPGGWAGLDPAAGGQELTLQLKARSRRFLPLLVLQVFHGYGENLLNYKDNRFGVRAGLGF